MISVDSEKTRILLEEVNNLSPYVVGYPHPLQTLVDVLIPLRVPILTLSILLLIIGLRYRYGERIIKLYILKGEKEGKN